LIGTKVSNLLYRHTSKIFSIILLDTLVFGGTLKSKKIVLLKYGTFTAHFIAILKFY